MKNFKLDLNKPLMLATLKPAQDTDRTLGQILSMSICQSSDANPLKFWGWAIKLEANETLELDSQDKELLHSWVTNHKSMSNLLKGQILQEFLDQDK